MRTLRVIIKTIIVCVIVVIGAGLIYMYSGAYNVGQDVPHNGLTHWLLETGRDRSIANHASNVKAPAVKKTGMVKAGAKLYTSHCSGCHLAPGKTSSPIRDALYPRPPDLPKHKHLDATEAFWIIKHGIKFTAMPAWGTSLNDTQIWQLVAFLNTQASMTPAAYKALVAPAPQPTAPAPGSSSAAAATPMTEPGAMPAAASTAPTMAPAMSP